MHNIQESLYCGYFSYYITNRNCTTVAKKLILFAKKIDNKRKLVMSWQWLLFMKWTKKRERKRHCHSSHNAYNAIDIPCIQDVKKYIRNKSPELKWEIKGTKDWPIHNYVIFFYRFSGFFVRVIVYEWKKSKELVRCEN